MAFKMTEDELLHSLPKAGPFRLSWRFFFHEWFSAGLGFFALFGGGTALVVYAFFISAQLIEMESIWKRGQKAQIVRFYGKVRTTQLVFRSYHLRAIYRIKKDQVFQTKSSFFRFFSGPQKGDAYQIRYLLKMPALATISWEYEARYHGWTFVGILVFLGILLIWLSVRVLRTAIQITLYTTHLATEGHLVAAIIESVQEVTEPNTAQPSRIFRFSWFLTSPFQGSYLASAEEKEPVVFHNEERLLLLAVPQFSEYLVLHKDGYPLLLEKEL